MRAPALELGDIFRLHGPAYLTTLGDSLSHEQKKALREIAICRTAALGGHVEECDRCGYRKISYCSCRNRHCPKCHGRARARWLEQRGAELLPVEYFHVVFTVPQLVAPLALRNQRVVYGILFRAAAETLLQIAADRRHLGARIGFLAVLHTWGQNLHHHPHLHCVVPGGGIAPDQRRWISCRRQFLFPVKVLSRLFRAKFVAYLKAAFREGELGFHGQLKSLGEKRLS
jgi:Transposase zinc-binding domain/Putative transposase